MCSATARRLSVPEGAGGRRVQSVQARPQPETLEDEHRERIEQLYAAFADEEGMTHVADLDELAATTST